MARSLILIVAVIVCFAAPSAASADLLHCTYYFDYDYQRPYLLLTIPMSGFNQFYDYVYVEDAIEKTRHKEPIQTFKHDDLLYGFVISKNEPKNTMIISIYEDIVKDAHGKEGWKSVMYPPNAAENMVTGMCWPEYVDE